MLNYFCLSSGPGAPAPLFLAQGKREGQLSASSPKLCWAQGWAEPPRDPSLEAVARTSFRKRP